MEPLYCYCRSWLAGPDILLKGGLLTGKRCQSIAKRSAFTLIEVLVVIGILALLIALLLPVIDKARLSAASTTCLANLRTLGVAHISYRADNSGRNPPYNDVFEGHQAFGGMQHLTPYYRSGPPYVWDGGKGLPSPATDRCPVTRLRPELDGNGSTYGDYSMMPQNETINLNVLPNQSKIPVIFDSWKSGWRSFVPLRHNNFNGINAVFLDGHVETISQDKSDGRLYWGWWEPAIRDLNPDDANLGKGRQAGSLTAP